MKTVTCPNCNSTECHELNLFPCDFCKKIICDYCYKVENPKLTYKDHWDPTYYLYQISRNLCEECVDSFR